MNTSMRFGKNSLFVAMWVASVIVAFSLPDNLGQSETLSWVVRSVSAVVPAVSNVRQISTQPDVAAAYFAVMWILVLIWIPPYFYLSDEQINSFSNATKRKTAFLFFPALLIAVIWLLFFLPPTEPGRIFKVVLHSRFGLGFIGGAVFCGIPLFVRTMLMWIHYLPRVLDESDGSNIKGGS